MFIRAAYLNVLSHCAQNQWIVWDSTCGKTTTATTTPRRVLLGHVCQTSVRQELSDEEKQLFQAQHARGPTYKLGTSKPDHLQLQVMSTTAGSVLHFWISERWKVLLPQKETLSPMARPASLVERTGPCGGAWCSLLLAKGPPFPCLSEQSHRLQAAAANWDWFYKQPLPPGAAPALSELCVSSSGVFFATATEVHLYTV